MNHSINLTDTLTFSAECVGSEPKIYVGQNATALVKARFKYPDGNFFGFINVDFWGMEADKASSLKIGKKYLINAKISGRLSKDEKVFMGLKGEGLTEL